MQIVIDIDDKQVLSAIKNRALGAENKIDRVIINALYNGTPLPKGHGRLVDADDITDFEGHYITTDAPTIIEADDKESD